MPTSFEELQLNQLCTFIYTEEMEQDIRIGVKTTNVDITIVYSMKGANTSYSYIFSIDSEFCKRRCTFLSAGEVLYINPEDYPELQI